MKNIRVLVVDDSAFMRHTIVRHLSDAPGIDVVGAANDGVEALALVRSLAPDVVTLDVEMPRMDGLETLRQLMVERPLPVVMVSSLTQEGAETTIRALELGAVDFVPKPSGSVSLDFYRVKDSLVAAIIRASMSHVRPAPAAVAPARPVVVPAGRSGSAPIVVIGASTGGPRALHHLIPALPADFPSPVLIVQHMPPGFTRSLAQRLDDLSPLTVREADTGDSLHAGLVLVAPGGKHMVLRNRRRVGLSDAPPEHGVRPAIDVTLRSVVENVGANAVGVILTGMGQDGAQGVALLHQAGGATIAEDESTCVVYGMPRAAAAAGARVIAPLPEIADAIVRATERAEVWAA